MGERGVLDEGWPRTSETFSLSRRARLVGFHMVSIEETDQVAVALRTRDRDWAQHGLNNKTDH